MVLDGELAVLHEGRLDFAALQQRARLGGFRARSVARARPAHVVTFDLLEADGEELLAMPYRERSARLETLFTGRKLAGRWALVGSTPTARRRWPGWTRPGAVSVSRAWSRNRPPAVTGPARGLVEGPVPADGEAVVGAATGTVTAPDTLLLGQYDSATARRKLGELLTPAGPDLPWTGVQFSSAWGARAPLVHAPVEPAFVAEFASDTSVDDAGRYRHPVDYVQLRGDLAPGTVPPLA